MGVAFVNASSYRHAANASPLACLPSYVKMVWSELQAKPLVVPMSWMYDQLDRSRAGVGRADLDQMLKDLQRDSIWVNGCRVTGANGARVCRHR